MFELIAIAATIVAAIICLIAASFALVAAFAVAGFLAECFFLCIIACSDALGWLCRLPTRAVKAIIRRIHAR